MYAEINNKKVSTHRTENKKKQGRGFRRVGDAVTSGEYNSKPPLARGPTYSVDEKIKVIGKMSRV